MGQEIIMSGLSFKFSKTSEKKVLGDSKLRDSSTKDNAEERDFIKDVKDKAIIGSIKPKENKPLVIPMIKANNYDWRTKGGKSDNKDDEKVTENGDKEETLAEKAARELLAEAAKQNQDWNERSEDGKPKLDAIPTLIANALPGEMANEDHLDVSLRAEASTMDDYDNVPIEQFGMAMLRGMGWKEGDGIGGFKNEVVPIFDPQVRPKGLGLGATRKKDEKQVVVKEGEEKLVLKKGAYVKIESGVKKGLYGEIEGLDEENARVIIKLTVNKEVTSVSENSIQLVTKSEFKERGKVVNIDKYEKFKDKEKEKQERRRSKSPEKRKYKESEKYRRKSRSRSPSKKAKSKVVEVSDSDSCSSPEVKRKKVIRTWVQAGLRVRCVDSKWKDGKYYNVKMEVIDVVTQELCDCRTDQGKLVQDVRTDKLETLIPKQEGGVVMVVRGSSSGQLGRVVARDKSRYIATVQLIHTEEVLSLDYDNICEYVRSVPDDE